MRRVAALLLVLTPLSLALLYAAAHALLGPRPSLEGVVPKMAVLTARFRGVEAWDEHWPFDRPAEGRVSESVAASRNVAGLPGVDRSGPIHFLLLPREARANPSMLILPVNDADALRRRFEGRDVPADDPRGLQRHAQHLEIRGDFAALSWDREAVRHLGEGGVTCEDRGEDFALAADVPGLVAFALSNAGQPPWRQLVEALGAEPGKAETKVDPETGARKIEFPIGRVARLAEGWRTARLWAWKQRKEVEIELEPADAGLVTYLKEAATAPEMAPGSVPESALAWLEIYGRASRRALARGLYASGVKGAERLFDMEPSTEMPAWTVRLWAVANVGEGHGWTIVLAAINGSLPLLTQVLPGVPALNAPIEVAPGAAPATLSDTRWTGDSPAGHIARLPPGDELKDGLAIGADALRIASVETTAAALTRKIVAFADQPGHRTLARFGLAPQRMNDVLGTVASPGGLFGVLAGGGIDGEITTDGRVLRVKLRAAAK